MLLIVMDLCGLVGVVVGVVDGVTVAERRADSPMMPSSSSRVSPGAGVVNDRFSSVSASTSHRAIADAERMTYLYWTSVSAGSVKDSVHVGNGEAVMDGGVVVPHAESCGSDPATPMVSPHAVDSAWILSFTVHDILRSIENAQWR